MRGGLTHVARGCVVALILVAGCGGGGTSATIETAPPAPVLTPAQQARADARAARQERIELERTFVPNPWREPGDTAPHSRPLRHLIVHEVKRGTGPPLRGDEIVYGDFVKTFWKSGRKFLAAWGPLRTGYISLLNEAPGIQRGMTGMRLGGRRTIAMPKAISDVHPPNGIGGFTAAQVDIVLRKIGTE